MTVIPAKAGTYPNRHVIPAKAGTYPNHHALTA